MAGDAVQEEQTQCNRNDDDEAEVCVPEANATDIEADLAEIPDSNVEHFFVDADPSNPATADEVIGLEGDQNGMDSITRFLTLPTVARRVSARHRDP